MFLNLTILLYPFIYGEWLEHGEHEERYTWIPREGKI